MIKAIEERIQKISDKILEYETRLTDTSDFALELSLNSLRAHRDDLVDQKRQFQYIHGKEIVELRLKGEAVEYGSVPVRFLSDVVENVALSIQAAAYHLQTGSDPRRIPNWIRETLNLRFVGVKTGSARLFIEGDTSPDLFGNSLLQQTLSSFFSFLRKDSAEEILEDVESLGIKSIKNLHGLFSSSLRQKVDIDLGWNTITAEMNRWQADRTSLEEWKNRIEQIQSRTLEDLNFSGTVTLLSLTGRIEIQPESGTKIKALFPRNLYDKIREIRLGDEVEAILGRKQVVDISRGIDRVSYAIKDIEVI